MTEIQHHQQTHPYRTKDSAPAAPLFRQAVWPSVLIVTLIALTVFWLRAFYLDRSFDIFIDEITYLRIAKEVATNGRVYLYGTPFFLHPPAFFYMEAAFLTLFPVGGHTIEQIQAVRYLNVALSALSAVLLYLIVTHAASRRWGIVAATLFALDPFVIRMNSRNLLDIAAIFWVLLGLWLLLGGFRADRVDSRPGIRTTGRNLLVGLAFGLALLTKDMMLFLTLLPLALVALQSRGVPRRDAIMMGAVTALTYLFYLFVVVGLGYWDEFISFKTRGVLRLVGLIQETGINRPVGPSLGERLLVRLEEFGITYGLILLGLVALFVLAKQRQTIPRLLALWTACAYALLVYLVLFGTLEEQFFYYLVVPCMAAVPVALSLLPALNLSAQVRRWSGIVAAALGIFFLVAGSYQWAIRHFTPDNGYEQLIAYLDAHVTPDTDVASTSETGQFLLDGYLTGPWGQWSTLAELQRFNPDYLVVSSSQIEWEHGEAARPMLTWLDENGTVVWRFEGRTTGQLLLYRLPETGVSVPAR